MNRYGLIYTMIFFFIALLLNSYEESTSIKKNHIVEIKSMVEVPKRKLKISLREIATWLQREGRESESRIFLEVLEKDSICILRNKYSDLISFEKPIKVLQKFDQKRNCFVILNVVNRNDTVLVELAKPFAYSGGIVKGGLGWSVSVSDHVITVVSLEY